MAKATETKSNEVAVQKNSAVAVPDFMQQDMGQGFGNIDNSDLQTPRIILLQSVSPQVEEFESARPGMFWHDTLNAPLGSVQDGFIFTPVFIDKRATLWRPRAPIDQGGILARSADLVHWVPSNTEFEVKIDKKGTKRVWNTRDSVAASRLLEWGTYDPEDPNSQPAATLSYNLVAAAEDEEMGMMAGVVTFQRSSAAAAKKFLARAKLIRAPLFGLRCKLSSQKVEGPSGAYYVPKVDVLGMLGADDLDFYHACKAMSDSFAENGLKMKDADEDDAAMAPGRGNSSDADEALDKKGV